MEIFEARRGSVCLNVLAMSDNKAYTGRAPGIPTPLEAPDGRCRSHVRGLALAL
jgi:hypothetical protein